MPPEDPAYEAIRALRRRLAELEAYAQALPRPGLTDAAIADAMAKPKPTRGERDLANLAHFHDSAADSAFRERERVGAERYDAALQAAGGDLLAQSISLAAEAAHAEIKKGTSK